jgi:hypothetical protein
MPRRRCRAVRPIWTKKACAEKIKISNHSPVIPPIAPFGRRTTGTTSTAPPRPVNFASTWGGGRFGHHGYLRRGCPSAATRWDWYASHSRLVAAVRGEADIGQGGPARGRSRLKFTLDSSRWRIRSILWVPFYMWRLRRDCGTRNEGLERTLVLPIVYCCQEARKQQ